MEAVLVREGDQDHVRIGRDGGPVAFVWPARHPDGSVCVIDLWNQHPPGRPGFSPDGRVFLDHRGEITFQFLDPNAEPYWEDMPWFGWLMDLTIDAGLDLSGTGAVS
jgi:hypothetical protein